MAWTPITKNLHSMIDFRESSPRCRALGRWEVEEACSRGPARRVLVASLLQMGGVAPRLPAEEGPPGDHPQEEVAARRPHRDPGWVL